MKLTCQDCSIEYDGTINLSNIHETPEVWKWVSSCPSCGKVFEIEAPKGKILMAFADCDRDDYEDYFTDHFEGREIISLYAFDDANSFLDKWREIVEDPDGMWYWVLCDGNLVCSGACDPNDEEIYSEYFEVDITEENT